MPKKGDHMPESAKESIRLAQIGKIVSKETRKKISEGLKKAWREGRATGCPSLSPEARKKLSNATRKRWETHPETFENARAALVAYWTSERRRQQAERMRKFVQTRKAKDSQFNNWHERTIQETAKQLGEEGKRVIVLGNKRNKVPDILALEGPCRITAFEVAERRKLSKWKDPKPYDSVIWVTRHHPYRPPPKTLSVHTSNSKPEDLKAL
jgi:hypothetical protein